MTNLKWWAVLIGAGAIVRVGYARGLAPLSSMPAQTWEAKSLSLACEMSSASFQGRRIDASAVRYRVMPIVDQIPGFRCSC